MDKGELKNRLEVEVASSVSYFDNKYNDELYEEFIIGHESDSIDNGCGQVTVRESPIIDEDGLTEAVLAKLDNNLEDIIDLVINTDSFRDIIRDLVVDRIDSIKWIYGC